MGDCDVSAMEELMARPYEAYDFCGNCSKYGGLIDSVCKIDGEIVEHTYTCDAFERLGGIDE